MVIVYMESVSHSEIVAKFNNEELYIKLLPYLEKIAKKQGMIITEAINEELLK